MSILPDPPRSRTSSPDLPALASTPTPTPAPKRTSPQPRLPAPVLVSACLAGWPCRYDGQAKPDPHWVAQVRAGRAIPFCPEMAGGLTVPRAPAEIEPAAGRAAGDPGKAVWQGTLRVITRSGQDVTEAYREGARQACAVARAAGVREAVLKERSPACGVHQIYDGRHTGSLVAGQGVATAALRAAGIRVRSNEEEMGRSTAR